MMHNTLVTSEALLVECSRRLPEHEGEMRRNFRIWEEREQSVILKAQRRITRDPKIVEFDRYVERIVVKNVENIADAPFDQATRVLADY